MKPYFADGAVALHLGKALDVLPEIPDASIDAVVCDPPYALTNLHPNVVIDALTRWLAGNRAYIPSSGRGGFMGASWDEFVPPPAAWDECLRVLKPGGHLLAFAAPRTQDLMGLSIRIAGFEIRDGIDWIFGNGMPKGQNIAKGIDRRRDDRNDILKVAAWLTAARDVAGWTNRRIDALWGFDGMAGHWTTQGVATIVPTLEQWKILRNTLGFDDAEILPLVEALNGRKGTAGEAWDQRPAAEHERRPGMAESWTDGVGLSGTTARGGVAVLDEARQWEGWNTSLKPAHEPVIRATKPFPPSVDLELIGFIHHALGGVLWLSLSPAKRAETISKSLHGDSSTTTCVSALVAAALSPSPAKSDRTATFNSPAADSTCWSIAGSWNAILGALSAPTRTSTISTASNTTTALRTLSSLLAPVALPSSIPRCECLNDGVSHPAPSVGRASSDAWSNWLNILSRSVPASAIEGIALAASSVLASIAKCSLSALGEASSALSLATARPTVNGSTATHESIVVARKSTGFNTVAANVLQHGTGAINIDACRVEGIADNARANKGGYLGYRSGSRPDKPYAGDTGRWPTNIAFSHSPACAGACVPGCPVADLDAQTGTLTSGANPMRRSSDKFRTAYGEFAGERECVPARGTNSGGASRFFPAFRYEGKASVAERPRLADGTQHPTTKPLDLMRWLVRLVTPPGGTVLDPFAGSGTTLEACLVEGFRSIGIEQHQPYVDLCVKRLSKPIQAVLGFDEEAAS